MRILVTGGAGFIGSHLVARLLSDGHQVTAFDNLATGRSSNMSEFENNPNFHFVQGSILDQTLIVDLASKSEYVFHLAAAVGVFNIMANPLESLLTNIRGTENVLEACHLYGIPIFLTSSSEVYGKNSADSLQEQDDRILGSPTTLRWSYSEAKAIDESLTHAYHVERKLETRIVRFFNVVGPRQLGSYGMVLPRFVQSALIGDPIVIYGTGLQTRCFAHIEDVINAVNKVAFSPETIGEVLNIGNNKEVSMNELASKVLSLTNSKSEIRYISYEEAYGEGFEDMERRVPNLEKIKNLVGWEPEKTLDEIILDIAVAISKT